MSHAHQFPLERERQGGILLFVVALHVAVLYGVAMHKLHQTRHRSDPETRVDILWDKTIAKTPRPTLPQPSRSKAAAPAQATPAPVRPPQESEQAPAPAIPNPPEAKGDKPLDLQQILKDVGTETRKLDGEHPGDRAMQAGPNQPSFEAKLDKVLANAKPPPKFNEAARIEEISSGAQLDAGIRMYKVTTFVGTYCVTYDGASRPLVTLCPIRF